MRDTLVGSLVNWTRLRKLELEAISIKSSKSKEQRLKNYTTAYPKTVGQLKRQFSTQNLCQHPVSVRVKEQVLTVAQNAVALPGLIIALTSPHSLHSNHTDFLLPLEHIPTDHNCSPCLKCTPSQLGCGLFLFSLNLCSNFTFSEIPCT